MVWPESKQIGLVDSIFRNFYVPPVIFAVQRDDEGETVRVCVDGKQRLTSIQKFLDGLVSNHVCISPPPVDWCTARYLVSVTLQVSTRRAEGTLSRS